MARQASLPKADDHIIHAASMPIAHDTEAPRPWCRGLFRTSQMFGLVAGVASFLVFPAVHMRLHQDDYTYKHASQMIGITLLMAFFWVFEVLPVYVTAMIPLVLIPVMGITTMSQLSTQYWNWIQLLFMGAFMVNAAVEHSGLPRRVALCVLTRTANTPGMTLFSFMIVCWVMSMCCSTITTTLMVGPIATGLIQEAEDTAHDEEDSQKDSSSSSSDDEDQAAFPAGTKKGVRVVRRYADGLLLGIAFGSLAGGIATIIGNPANAFLAGRPIVAGKVTWLMWFVFALPVSFATLVVSFCVLYVLFVRNSGGVQLTSSFLKAEYILLGRVRRDEIVAGSVLALQIFLWAISGSVLSAYFKVENGEPSLNDACISCFCALLVFVLPSEVNPGQPVLPWKFAQERVEWGQLLLMGGAFTLARGFEDTGLDIVIGVSFGRYIHYMSPLMRTFVIVAVSSISTQIFGGIASAAVFLVILSNSALYHFMHPLGLMLPATVASSFAFVIPTSTPTLAVILAKSIDMAKPLTFRDFLKAGLPVNFCMAIIGSLLVVVMGHLVFATHESFPRYACIKVCDWVTIPGANGSTTHQGCVTFDGDGEMCTLANGTKLVTCDYAYCPWQ